ncbi:poly [ADP-ribose] polymerase tankyrase-like isoform X1 [Dreissena polymorpha]|nr:poly [ADP-ribose] polymerase tankyrase-like isoform X1 [Dreissena polymorpha]
MTPLITSSARGDLDADRLLHKYDLPSVSTKQKMTIEGKVKRSQSMRALSTFYYKSLSSSNDSDSSSTSGQTSPKDNLPKIFRSSSVYDIQALNCRERLGSIVRRFWKRSRSDKPRKLTPGERVSCDPVLCGDVNAVDSKGRTLLFYAARYGQLETARQLVEAGCGLDQTDFLGMTPLHEAIEKGHLEIAEVFLKDGRADPNIPKRDGMTPLITSSARGDLDAVRLLHKYGADVNKCDVTGCTPIFRAIQSGWNAIADFLLDKQCDVNKTAANGMTCFFAASHCNKINVNQITRRLLKADYEFKKDKEWLETEGFPITMEDDSELYVKIAKRAGLRKVKRQNTFMASGKRMQFSCFRSNSTEG